MATFQNASALWTSDLFATSGSWLSNTGSLLDLLGSALPPETPVDTPFELTARTGVAMLLTMTCGLLANAGGIGGGPFYIPVFNVLLGFSLKMSTALSLTVVASGALASTLYGLGKKSPRDRNRTLLDFDLVLTFLPAFLFGVNFGVLFNVLIPDWLQTALLVFLLVFVVRTLVIKARRQYAIEQATLQRRLTPPVLPKVAANSPEEPLLPALNGDHSLGKEGDGSPSDHDDVGTGELLSEELQRAISLPRRTAGKRLLQRIPFKKFAAILVLWVLFLVSQAHKSGYHRCSWEYAAIWLCQVAVLLAVCGSQILHQVRKARTNAEDLDPEIRVMLTHGSLDSEIRHPVKTLTQVACVIASAGVGAGLLGVGGAIFFNPWLFHLGVHPQVVVSTAVLMILFSSSAISLSLSFHDLLNHSYALRFAPLTFLASLIGVTLVGRWVRKSGRTSIILIILTALVFAGMVTIAIFGGLRSYEQIVKGKDSGFRPFCAGGL